MIPVLINKGVFEPSYNDLKFMVQKHNYFFTSLNVLGFLVGLWFFSWLAWIYAFWFMHFFIPQ